MNISTVVEQGLTVNTAEVQSQDFVISYQMAANGKVLSFNANVAVQQDASGNPYISITIANVSNDHLFNELTHRPHFNLEDHIKATAKLHVATLVI